MPSDDVLDALKTTRGLKRPDIRLSRAIYADRADAGSVLAAAAKQQLGLEASRDKALVLAIPRGGVPIGRDVAAALGADLDIVVPRKLGAEGNPEYALGAVMHDGELYLNPEAVGATGATSEYIESRKAVEMREASRRLAEYRGVRPEPAVSGRLVMVVDDGIATGATMIAALRWVRSRKARVVMVAVPVAPPSTVQELRDEADGVICPKITEPFYAIGAFYEDFAQVADEEVRDILREYWRLTAGGSSAWSTSR